jgi:hypothetical protein
LAKDGITLIPRLVSVVKISLGDPNVVAQVDGPNLG